MKDREFELYIENKCLGKIRLSDEADFPWFVGKIVFTEIYEQYEDLFVEYEEHFKRESKGEVNDCMRMWEEIRAKGIKIKCLDTNTVTIPSTVNIADHRIAWR